MTDREIMQQAQLEKLEGTLWILNQELTRKQAEIDALRERLAQPETVMAEYKFQTYAAYKTPDGEMKIGVVPETRPATREEKIVRPGVYEVPVEQEPVAFITNGGKGELWWSRSVDENGNANMNDTPLYTTPPRRDWVGLTEEEKVEILRLKWWDWEDTFDLDGFIRAIEAKLKEKNNAP